MHDIRDSDAGVKRSYIHVGYALCDWDKVTNMVWAPHTAQFSLHTTFATLAQALIDLTGHGGNALCDWAKMTSVFSALHNVRLSLCATFVILMPV